MKRISTAVMLLLLLVVGAWGYNQYMQKVSYHRYLQAQYDRSFYQLVNSIENIETSTGKLMVSSQENTTIPILSDVWRQAFEAQENLSQLPIGQPELDNTSKFLSQIGDYSYSLSKNVADGGKLTDKDYKTISELHNYAVYLGKNLQDLRSKIQGGYDLGNLRKKGTQKMSQIDSKILNVNMSAVNQQMSNYPTLIYDGPFSESQAKLTPKGLTGGNVSYDNAVSIARRFIGKPMDGATKYSPNNGKINAYGIELKPPQNGPSIYVNVSKKGGHVIWFMDQRMVSKVNISETQALNYAVKFLSSHGFSNMENTYSIKANGTVQFNFAPVQNNVRIYPDIVKVKVALDNGDIVGFDATSYYMSHVNRTIGKPKLTEVEAQRKVSKNLKVDSSRLCIIPLDGGKEVLAYEFKGTYGGDTFYVYINAENGTEEKILKIIKTSQGNLTM
ncbi:germination protein YpeB [Thermoanaerobacterium thermosaccharolyticum]|jgi:spore germination protein|uniref:Germination protein YpeB n=2 Tax=Thermoanaerobacterium thermosaccharolyticum TaxID=1517 RepID=D9TPL0_THETC|nr:germination protein YpeB [Thermoanaerobacterium thermosaccharolyticum]ADL67792.1 germination protein YpeB [Thermoanaerobacterium thermosaccharolyticum DSM 571]AST57636.1 germination protein [Thermoanaerobacterium thermosaccharolyticum]PHO07630.1 germination protein YpeB [Thermoanaerobacterium thermosaccharolyticum]TCW42644.1 germination protein YpeB [Thermohydrogenium kirishiense]